MREAVRQLDPRRGVTRGVEVPVRVVRGEHRPIVQVALFKQLNEMLGRSGSSIGWVISQM